MSDWPGKYIAPEPPVRILQKPEEINELVEFYQELKPKTVLEIGSENGGTLWYWIKFAQPGTFIINCDPLLPFNPNSVEAHRIWPEWAKDTHIRLATFSGMSQTTAFEDFFVEAFGNLKIEFAFIDGQHDFTAVMQDFELCYRHLAPKGVIAMHDIAFPHIAGANEVQMAWKTIKERYQGVTREIISMPSPVGIGIFQKNAG